MKNYILKTLIFLTILFVVGSALIIYYTNDIRSSIDKRQLDDNITEVYMGDSHTLCAINDSLISNGQNLSQTAEAFFYTYYKLKRILKPNNKLERVFIGYSYHSNTASYDDFIYGEKSQTVSPKYFFIIPMKEKVKLIAYNKHNFSAYLKGVISAGQDNLNPQSENNFFGSYRNQFKKSTSVIKSMDKRVEFQYISEEDDNIFSSNNLAYFYKIIALCKERNVELILINTPLHPYYKNKIPEKYVTKYNEIIRENDLTMIDLSDMQLSDDCYSPDGDHVSVKGAMLTTKQFLKVK